MTEAGYELLVHRKNIVAAVFADPHDKKRRPRNVHR